MSRRDFEGLLARLGKALLWCVFAGLLAAAVFHPGAQGGRVSESGQARSPPASLRGASRRVGRGRWERPLPRAREGQTRGARTTTVHEAFNDDGRPWPDCSTGPLRRASASGRSWLGRVSRRCS